MQSPDQYPLEGLDGHAAVLAVGQTLRRIDRRLMDHGARVAYIACELMEEGQLDLDKKTLLMLCLFHDIGAYKTDEISRMLEFETRNVWNHSCYGYLFLKYFTPLEEKAEAVLYHHIPWKETARLPNPIRNYAGMIHFADRVDIMARGDKQQKQHFQQLCENGSGFFSKETIEIFQSCVEKRRLFECLENGEYRQTIRQHLNGMEISSEEALQYLKMLVYSIDFRSEYTVTHTINTTAISLNIAKHFNLSKAEKEKIYLGALLHDVGKIAIPLEILEFPGKLTPEQMAVMRTHVSETESMIEGIVDDEICQIAARHHEKLDGSGYPHGRTAEELTFPQRIVAVADIISALASRRSYKEPFPQEKTIQILMDMQQKQLDGEICRYVAANYEGIMADTDTQRDPVIHQYQQIYQEFLQLQRAEKKSSASQG